MERGHEHHDHREYEDLLAAAALGALSQEEHAMLRRHLETCDSCRPTFGGLLAVADALPLQVNERAPSAGLRQRLRAQIEPEAITALSDHRNGDAPVPLSFVPDRHQPRPVVPKSPSRMNRPVWGLLAAAMLILAVLAGVVVDRLLLLGDDAPEEEIALDYPADIQSEQGSLAYLPDQGVLRFHAPDLPAPPADHVYQGWLIDASGPRAVGVIDPKSGELATAVNAENDTTFAITIEPAPLGSTAPSSDPVIVADLSDAT